MDWFAYSMGSRVPSEPEVAVNTGMGRRRRWSGEMQVRTWAVSAFS
jgi:hypothetical protein